MSLLAGCAQLDGISTGKALLASAQPATEPNGRAQTELEKATEYWGKEFAKNPRDAKAGLSYARNLKALGHKQQALAVLQQSAMYNANNREIASEWGRLAADLGQLSLAQKLLERADDPANPDWRVFSARGAVMAKQGQYKDAIALLERARQLAPEQASVLNNLALAYTLDGEPAKAEAMLQHAAASPQAGPRVRQNLALVLGVQGKYDEAKVVAGQDEGPERAAASVDQIRQLVRAEPKAPVAGQTAGAPPVRAASRARKPGPAAPLDWSEAVVRDAGQEHTWSASVAQVAPGTP